MSKNMLDPIIRALASVPESRLEIVADIANRLNSDRGNEWDARFKAVLREGLAPVPATVFERNEHGHFIITFIGLDLTGEQEIARLEAAEYRVGNHAKFCFKSTKADSYDKNHRLVAGQPYKIALIPGKEIASDSDRSTANLLKLGEKYGYGKPLGGHIPRIRETVSEKQMKDMGFLYIASPHDPIKDADGITRMLSADQGEDGLWVDAYWDNPGPRWHNYGAFAFPVSTS